MHHQLIVPHAHFINLKLKKYAMCIMVVGLLGSANGSSLLLTKCDGAMQQRG